MPHIVKGSEVKKGMLVRGRLGLRLIVEEVGDTWWSVRQARQDWKPDRRYEGWSGHLEPSSEWEVCGWQINK
jgi:hypothetical protein